ncbi:hypothetical protein HDU76_005898 [Blyttiomyces sp. JEL0837]|nr:hypothetical protein HDU76_005898 [Blyttiomyces sp. JEL0837]
MQFTAAVILAAAVMGVQSSYVPSSVYSVSTTSQVSTTPSTSSTVYSVPSTSTTYQVSTSTTNQVSTTPSTVYSVPSTSTTNQYSTTPVSTPAYTVAPPPKSTTSTNAYSTPATYVPDCTDVVATQPVVPTYSASIQKTNNTNVLYSGAEKTASAGLLVAAAGIVALFL